MKRHSLTGGLLALTVAFAGPLPSAEAVPFTVGSGGGLVVPKPVMPRIGITFGYGYRHPEKIASDCDPRTRGSAKTYKLTIRQIRGGVRLSFYSHDDPDIRSFRVSAMSQTLRPGKNPLPVWQTVKAPKGCRTVTTTVTGLRAGEGYDVWVDAISVRRVGAKGTIDRMIGRTGAFTAI